MTQHACPMCGGKGLRIVFACPGWTELKLPCRLCEQTGRISDEVLHRVEAGEKMRADRISRGINQREEAARLGISPQELSKKEQGLI